MSRRKFVVFAVAAVLLAPLVVVVALFGVDLYLHHRHGINVWGYRGPVVKEKRPGEQRIAVLGGSTAFGYGVPQAQSFPAHLEEMLAAARRRAGRGPVSVVNLAFNSEGAYSFFYTLQDYEYLHYDVVLLYTGYNDLPRRGERPFRNTRVVRHGSAIFRLTGYWPLVVVTLGAKAAALRARLAGGGGPTIFWPDLANQTAAEALAAAAAVSRALESQLGRLTRLPNDGPPPMAEGCAGEWAHYCGAVHRAVRYALDRGKRVVVVTQPYVADRHVDQQRALRGMLRQQFGHDPRLQHVDLGRSVDLRDTTLSYDGMHLTGAGNRRVAEALVPPLREVLE